MFQLENLSSNQTQKWQDWISKFFRGESSFFGGLSSRKIIRKVKTKILILLLSIFTLLLLFVIFFPKYTAQEKLVVVPIQVPENKLSIFVAGDVMLDRQVRLRINTISRCTINNIVFCIFVFN